MCEKQCGTAETWTIAALLRWTTEYLARAVVDAPRLSAELLLAHALGCAKIELYTRFDQQPSDEQRTAFRELVRRAAEHQPIAYLVGHREFYSLKFEVTPEVLIPRPETEALVEQAIARCKEAGSADAHLLDLGTGSGCIAIAVLTQLPQVRAVGSDVSPGALAVARRNAGAHQVLDRLTLVEADGLALPAEWVPPGGFDFIVSNPPYVAEDELNALPRNVRDYEPDVALSAGRNGLAFYAVLRDDGPGLLKRGGSILVEIGAGQGAAVRQLMETGRALAHAGTWRDAADPHDRVMRFDLRPR